MTTIIDSLQLAANRIGVKPNTIITATAATLVSAFVFFRLAYPHRVSSPTPSVAETKDENKKEKTKPSSAMQRVHDAVKPEDGTVKVVEILIHPIKSARGLSVPSCKFTPLGLENDRVWCFVDATKNKIITAREFPRLVLIEPRIELDPESPHGGTLVVTFPPDAPEGCREFRVPLQPSPELLKEWEILDQLGLFSEFLDGYIGHAFPLPADPRTTPSTASAIASHYFDKPVHLVYKGPRPRPVEYVPAFPTLDAKALFQDGFPLLVMSKESMDELGEEVKKRVGTIGVGEEWGDDNRKVAARQFRPNVVVEGAGGFAEDAWEELPNVSPETGIRDKAVPFKVIMKFRTGLHPDEMLAPCVGVNGVMNGSGIINVGDVVYVTKMVPEVGAGPAKDDD
ncbi:hypothetical protein H0H92_010281 [Tricholoma furcatifolium]|nr:hypothetical protein H0H92_010281 [Tricholoma furcatifolium]